MASSDETPKPFQFGLRSLFVVTSVIAVALGVLKSIFAFAFVATLVLASISVFLSWLVKPRRKRIGRSNRLYGDEA